MASIRRQSIRGSTLELDQDFGLEGIIAYDSDRRNIRVYDGITLGGIEILNKDQIAAIYTLPERLTADGDSVIGLSANGAITNGWFRTDATTIDIPVAALGVLEVSVNDAASGAISQVWTRNSTGYKYFRSKTGGGAWQAWQRFVDLNFLTTDPTAKAYDADRLDGFDSAYYTDIVARLGYTPVNKAGDTITGALNIGTNLGVTGAATITGNLGVGGNFTVNNGASFNGGSINIAGGTPSVFFSDTTAGSDDFWALVNTDVFYILTDRGDDGTNEAPNPLELRNATATGFLYNNQIITQNLLTAAGYATIASLQSGAQRARPMRDTGVAWDLIWSGQVPLSYVLVSSDGVGVYPSSSVYYNSSIMQYRKVSLGYDGTSGGFSNSAGRVVVGYQRDAGVSGQVNGLYLMYLQVYDGVRGWVGFSDA